MQGIQARSYSGSAGGERARPLQFANKRSKRTLTDGPRFPAATTELFAWEDIEPGEYNDPDFLRKYDHSELQSRFRVLEINSRNQSASEKLTAGFLQKFIPGRRSLGGNRRITS